MKKINKTSGAVITADSKAARSGLGFSRRAQVRQVGPAVEQRNHPAQQFRASGRTTVALGQPLQRRLHGRPALDVTAVGEQLLQRLAALHFLHEEAAHDARQTPSPVKDFDYFLVIWGFLCNYYIDPPGREAGSLAEAQRRQPTLVVTSPVRQDAGEFVEERRRIGGVTHPVGVEKRRQTLVHQRQLGLHRFAASSRTKK